VFSIFANCSHYSGANINADYNVMNEIDRLKIRFQKKSEEIEFDGDDDDFDLPNIIEEEVETEEEETTTEESVYLYQDGKGHVFVSDQNYSSISEMIVDTYYQTAYLKNVLITQMSIERQAYAIL